MSGFFAAIGGVLFFGLVGFLFVWFTVPLTRENPPPTPGNQPEQPELTKIAARSSGDSR